MNEKLRKTFRQFEIRILHIYKIFHVFKFKKNDFFIIFLERKMGERREGKRGDWGV